MDEILKDFILPVEDKMQGIIKVIGVGGGGCNAVRNMYNEGVDGVTYAVCNTDSQSLSRSPVPVKIMLSEVDRKIFKKLGCGLTCDPVRKK